MNQESLFGTEGEKKPSGPVECLGMTFESDEARRAHFTELLREKLQDPEFRSIEGFPIGTDEAILELSDPPYYTACPNPWLSDFVELWESQKENSDGTYHREPFASDVSEGKNEPVYNAHSYHTKVPYKAIMRYLLHYTKPGDIVLDGFSGTGMTGVAAQMCADPELVKQMKVEDGIAGARKHIVSDLSPIASFISSGMLRSVDTTKAVSIANSICDKVEANLGQLYHTQNNGWKVRDRKSVPHVNGDVHGAGVTEFTVYADVVSCPSCGFSSNLYELLVDENNDKLRKSVSCPSCDSVVPESKWEPTFVNKYDHLLSKVIKTIEIVPVLINYRVGSTRYEKKPDKGDFNSYSKAEGLLSELGLPLVSLIAGKETQRNVSKGVTHFHQFFTDREHLYIASLLREIKQVKEASLRLTLLLALTASLPYASRMRRFRADRKGGGPLSGTLYIGSMITPPNVISTYKRNLDSILKGLTGKYRTNDCSGVTAIQSASSMNQIDDNSIDYIFTDPPFGHNFDYSELNFFWEALLGLRTNQQPEAIISSSQDKEVSDYKDLMTSCFSEYYRVLKPGRWITVEFSNSKAAVWNAIQSALKASGFIVANVVGLNKKQLSYKAVMTATAVKQDLIISAYKPLDMIDFSSDVELDNLDLVWDFISNHLSYLTVVRVEENELIRIAERDPRLLYDQLVAFYVRNLKDVPISSREFQKGLRKQFVERDGLFFLPEQVAEYDKKRAQSKQVKQLSIFVDDEASAIEWMRQELKDKPKTYSEIHPLFLSELSGWKKNELALELSTLLDQNFIKYDGKDEVPAQIHTYLSTNFKDMRGLDKSDPKLVAKAKDRWYVPDPNKAADLEKVRLRALLKEFETYKESKKKIKQPRAEALRAGFNIAWEAQDFQTILDISAKIPPAVLQEDEKLLMFYDNALTLTSTEDDEW